MNTFRIILLILQKKIGVFDPVSSLVYDRDPESPHLPHLCRESMAFGKKCCELPKGHEGHHYCKAI